MKWSFLKQCCLSPIREALRRRRRKSPHASSSCRGLSFLERLEDRTLPSSLSGTVFEDVNYGGGAGRSLAASAGVGVPGATVELYGGSGAFQQTTVTNGSGAYQFNGLQGNAIYFVRVVNGTVRSTRPGSTPGLLPVQTYRTDVAHRDTIPVTNQVGGEVPSAQDSGAKGPGGNLNDAAVEESVATIDLGKSGGGFRDSNPDVDFGFNFDTVVNTNNAGQGSLRQFITNSNALGNSGLAQVGQTAGVEASIFMIPSSADPLGRPTDPNFSGGVAHITLTSLLPAITDANTHIDGTTQTANVGDTNPGTLGAGGTVGVDNLTLPTVNRPEVELRDGNALSGALDLKAPGAAIRGLAIFGFGNDTITDANILVSTNASGAVIEQNVLGSSATSFTQPGTGAQTGGSDIFVSGAVNGVVQDNLIGFALGRGILFRGGTGWQILANEVRSNGFNQSSVDGIDLQNTSSNTIQGNLITGNFARGVDLSTAASTLLTDNTITGNGIGAAETAGVFVGKSNNTVSRNVLSANYGAGVAVGSAATNVLITQNSIFANGTITGLTGQAPTGQIGIDLLSASNNQSKGTAPFVTPNDPNDADSGGNGLLNFPVLVSAIVEGSTLELTGFARPGSVIELFIADPDPSGFGEGKTYLATLTEGSAQDLDTGTGSYGPGPVNGHNQGSDTTNRFRFDVPLASLLAPVGIGTVLTATATLGTSTSEFSGNVTVSASPTLTTSPSPVTVTLGAAPVTLTDSATLANGFNPTGTITFTLFHNGGGTPVDTETVTVNGNGIYTTPTGLTLPTTGTAVTGTYQWNATYSGDTNNSPLSDVNAANERVTVSAASPTLATTPVPDTVELGEAPVTLNDAAQLANGFNPTGTITFTLFQGNTLLDTETVTVSGNGLYRTPTGFTLPATGSVTGIYQWDATYSGDSNNSSVSDNDAAAERVTVIDARPTITTFPVPETVTLGTAPVTLKDVGLLQGGFNPTGTITFTLFFNGGGTPVDTETVIVNGNGTYTTPTGFTLPTTGTAVTGTYRWAAAYSGDTNNNPASESNTSSDFPEEATVSPASPTLITTPSPNTLAAGVTLKDTAFLVGGFNPTGMITFTLFFNGGGTPVDTETVIVNGNGTYTTPTGFAPGTASGTYQWNAIYSGDANNNRASDVNNPTEQVTVIVPVLTLSTTPTPDTVTLGTTPVTLNDTADLEGGLNPTGRITFTLFHNGGGTPVNTETVTVNGDGIYTTLTGFTLPSSGTVTGTYQWNATYSGDTNNGSLSDVNSANERVTVSAASPTLATIPVPDTVELGEAPVTLKDAAQLANGFNPTGTITFTLFQGNTLLDTETVTVSGNGLYRTPTGFTLPATGSVTGIYQWDATYSGDINNSSVSDNDAAAERVTVIDARPTITTFPVPETVTLGTAPVTLKDVGLLQGGFNPTGTITFTLFFNGGGTPVDTETVAVNGNGTYTTPTGFILPTTGTAVTGTYRWAAAYSGDTNNNPASESNTSSDFPEEATVSPASPTLITTPSPNTVTLGTSPVTLADTATLANGYFPSGSIVFTLTGPGGFSYTQIDTVRGNGAYTASTTLPTTGTVAGTYQWVAVYTGDTNNRAAIDNDPTSERVTVSAASPTLTTAPNPDTVTLDDTAPPPILTDSASLAGGFNPTGTITFTLFFNGGGTPVDTETVTVSGNGTYTTPTGFTLPTTAAAGTYQWIAVYSGDANNVNASDSNPAAEQTEVIPASPMLVTTASPSTVTLPAPVPTFLTDTADLTGGYFPTGSIIFTLTGPGGFVYTQTDTVSGNGAYLANTTLPTTGTVTGTYTWTANYEGDTNNAAANDQGGPAEQTVVGAASLTLVTIASPNVTLPTGPPGTVTLSDSAFLSGGHSPTGNIVFTLTGPGGFSQTRTDTVNGNGTYTASAALPTTGTVAGTYTWTARYSGDANNAAANDQRSIAEQTVVSPARPTLVTTASPNVALPTAPPGTVTLSDSAFLSGGYFPTGNIVFTLTGPDGFSYTQTDTVRSGTDLYSASTRLPTTGTVTGTYTWTAHYSGDSNNNAANDQGGPTEQTVVSPARPTLVTTADPAIRRGATDPTLTDEAVLSGGYFPTGNIVFTLTGPGGFSYAQTDTVDGNGTYTASTALPTTGTVAGTYIWTAHYSGDDNNNAANDQGDIAEQVTVAPFSPTITTTPNPSTVHLGGKLQDVANLTGGFDPTGSITFRLYAPGVDPTFGPAAYTETVTGVNGNGTYHTSVGFVANATGIWHWVATFNGDSNNNLAASGPLDEPVTVPQQADIALTKVVQQSQVMYGQNVTFTLIVHNKGPSAATDVFVDDPLPPGLAFVSATPSQGTFVSASGIWVVGTLANGATATLRLTARVAAFGPIVNRAEAGADQFDPDLSNNVAAAAVTGTNPAPIISKRSFLASTDPSPAPPAAGGPARPLPALDALRVDIVFINDLYEDVLGREAKPAELAFWINQLLLGVPRSAVARRV